VSRAAPQESATCAGKATALVRTKTKANALVRTLVISNVNHISCETKLTKPGRNKRNQKHNTTVNCCVPCNEIALV